ncbi:TPA: site-specific integrase [Vibrio parahaemolyticus]|nr:site-specific integrase [Vibrio parahaemolyticus]HCH0791331.1 site-specific integrase [Vibrio parahaemolyticus]
MRYLKITPNGNWHFRYQIPPKSRHLFSDLSEVKKSFGSCGRQQAIIESLKLELQIRIAINTNQPFSASTDSSVAPAKPALTALPAKSKITRSSPSTNPLTCLKKYRDSKRDLVSEKSLTMAYSKCAIVLSLLDMEDIRDIRRLQAEDARKLLALYPINAKKQKKLVGLSGLQVIEANKKHNLPTLSAESIKDYIQKCSSFFEWCLQMELTDINPFKGMRFKKNRKDSEAKNAYSQVDIRKLFSTEIHTKRKHNHPHYYWLPLLGLLTGARLNELCQLYKQDILKQDGIWVIRIDDKLDGQRVKNSSSRRLVPIHNKLLELGFIEYVNSVEHERIFPALNQERDGFGTAASKWFGRLKTKLGFGRGHDFHSFRHTVATQLKNADVSVVIAGELLGHMQNNITYDRYGKSINLSTMQKALNSLDASAISNVVTYSKSALIQS